MLSGFFMLKGSLQSTILDSFMFTSDWVEAFFGIFVDIKKALQN
jgi:hypothetical protein